MRHTTHYKTQRLASHLFKKKNIFYNGFNTYATPGVAHNP